MVAFLTFVDACQTSSFLWQKRQIIPDDQFKKKVPVQEIAKHCNSLFISGIIRK